MSNVKVICTVANCFFHKEENLCGAPSIEVNVDERSYTTEEFSQELGAQNRKGFATTSVNTCCQTFKPKEKK